MIGKFTEVEEALKRALERYAQETEKLIRKSLIGSTITDIKARYNPNTQDYTIQIHTTAEAVEMAHPIPNAEVKMKFHPGILTIRGLPEDVNIFS